MDKNFLSIHKKELLFTGILLLAVLLIFAFSLLLEKSEGDYAIVTIDGEVYGTYSLKEDCEIPLYEEGADSQESSDSEIMNLLVISEGECYMEEATCPDKLCIKQGTISKDGESIVCLPHKVVVTVSSHETSEIDAITN